MVVPCVAELSDPVNDAMVPRRCSARIKKLKSEQEAQRERESQRVRCRSNDDSVLGKKTKVYKKSKLVTPSQAQTQAPNNDVTVATVDNDDVTITNVGAPIDCTDHPVPENSLNPQLSGNGTEKSSHARVTETLRIFNKHYLHFVQEEEIRCGRAQADQKTKKHSKSKEAEDDGKRSSKRPDLKAISKACISSEVHIGCVNHPITCDTNLNAFYQLHVLCARARPKYCRDSSITLDIFCGNLVIYTTIGVYW